MQRTGIPANNNNKRKILGLTLLSISIWIRVDPEFWEYETTLDVDNFHTVCIMFIVASIFILIVGFVGCFGAATERRWLLIMYIVIFGIVFLLQLGALVLMWSAPYSKTITKELEKQIQKQIESRNTDDSSRNFVDFIQYHKPIVFYSTFVHWANHVLSRGSRPMLTSKGTRWPILLPMKPEPVTSSTMVFDANAVAKQKLCSNPRKKFLLPELNYSREITTTITRLRTKHFKGMKILPDGFRSYVECRHCPGTQLDPKYRFSCPSIVCAFFKIDNDSRMDILYSDRAMDVAKTMIHAFGNIRLYLHVLLCYHLCTLSYTTTTTTTTFI
ncbi:RNase H domain-containing protein [Trichonephila clavipes]|nr:RNase H domain-containing protein [Trichonephila clavipes]